MQVKDILKGKVIKINTTHILVELSKNQVGIVHISEVSDYFVLELDKMFNINNYYWFQVIGIDDKQKRINLSWKNLVPRFLKNPFQFTLEETSQGFKNLKKKEKFNG